MNPISTPAELIDHPLLALLYEFLQARHTLSEEILVDIQEKNPADLTINHDQIFCINCSANMLNWAQLGRFKCPPRDKSNPLEKANSQPRPL